MNTKKWLSTLGVAALTVVLTGLVAPSASADQEVCPNTDFVAGVGGWIKTDGLDSTTWPTPDLGEGYLIDQICYKASTTVVYLDGYWETVESTVLNPNGNAIQDLSHASVHYHFIPKPPDGYGKEKDVRDPVCVEPRNGTAVIETYGRTWSTTFSWVRSVGWVESERVYTDWVLLYSKIVEDPACNMEITAVFDVAPTMPTCTADGYLDTSVFPIDREGYVLTVDRPFDGPGDYVVTATAKPGYTIVGPTTATVTVLPKLTDDPTCRVGGKTIGYYKNHPVSEATWDAARAAYPNVLGSLPNWANALAVLNAANNKDDGTAMLRAQFIASALNNYTIDGWGDQYVVGTTTAAEFLAWVNANYNGAALDTKAERTWAKTILDNANQDA